MERSPAERLAGSDLRGVDFTHMEKLERLREEPGRSDSFRRVASAAQGAPATPDPTRRPSLFCFKWRQGRGAGARGAEEESVYLPAAPSHR